MIAVGEAASGAPLLTAIVLSVAVPAAFLRPRALDDDEAWPFGARRAEPHDGTKSSPRSLSGGRHYWAMMYVAFVAALIAYSAMSLTVPGGFRAPDAPLRDTLLTAAILLLAVAAFVHVTPLFMPISDPAERREVAKLAAQVAFSGVLAGAGYASGWLAGLPPAAAGVGFALPMTIAHVYASKYQRLLDVKRSLIRDDRDSHSTSAGDSHASTRTSRRRRKRRRKC